jgi:hypothetical protein
MPDHPLEDVYVHPSLPPSATDFDGAHAAVEVVILWGESVLHVSHLAPPRAFYVGETETTAGSRDVDYVIGKESLGVERLPIVLESGGAVTVVFGAGARGEISLSGHTISLDELEQQGQLWSLAEIPGARQYRLPRGAAVWVQHGGFTFLVRPTSAARWVDLRSDPLSLRRHTWTLSSTVLHLLFLLAFYLLPPHSAALSLDRLETDSRWVEYGIEPPERADDSPRWLADGQDAAEGGTGRAHDGERGQLGDAHAKPSPHRFAIKGRADNTDPQMSRDQAKLSAASAGIIGVLRAGAMAGQAPSSPFGRTQAEGNDAMDALGALLGPTAGANFGNGGLGPIGTGRGGGGDGKGTIGMGPIATIGHGPGAGPGSGYGSAAGGGLRDRESHPPRIRSGPSDVHGSLSKEVIRRTIGRHVNEVRFCYQQALTGRPDLQGRVAIKFVIAPSGAVQTAVVESSDVSYGGHPTATVASGAGVETCIASAVRRWTFPAPEGGGLVIVTYPFLLSQAGN